MVDLDVSLGVDLLEFLANALGEILGVGDEGKTLSVPYSLIKLGGLGGTQGQNKAIENDLPFPGGNVDHPGVTEKLAQVLAQSLGGRFLGGTELHEDHLGFTLGRDVIGMHLLKKVLRMERNQTNHI